MSKSLAAQSPSKNYNSQKSRARGGGTNGVWAGPSEPAGSLSREDRSRPTVPGARLEVASITPAHMPASLARLRSHGCNSLQRRLGDGVWGGPGGGASCQSLPHRQPWTHQAELANVNILLLASDFYEKKKYPEEVKESWVLFPIPFPLSREATPGTNYMYFFLIPVFTRGCIHMDRSESGKKSKSRSRSYLRLG